LVRFGCLTGSAHAIDKRLSVSLMRFRCAASHLVSCYPFLFAVGIGYGFMVWCLVAVTFSAQSSSDANERLVRVGQFRSLDAVKRILTAGSTSMQVSSVRTPGEFLLLIRAVRSNVVLVVYTHLPIDDVRHSYWAHAA
jgi:hypothetical protein